VALQNARLHSDLEALTLTDPLTGLANRRHLELHLRKEVAAARRGRAVTAVMFDLDDFKRYNDTKGHALGDDILRAFGRILTEENRAMGLVARYGGDEFVSILSDSTRDGGLLYVQRIRELLAFDALLARYEVRVTAGVAAFDSAAMETGEELVAAADADLYRNRGVRADPAAGQAS
jgi:diguanylate cyclase (GGDEF)-like protein